LRKRSSKYTGRIFAEIENGTKSTYFFYLEYHSVCSPSELGPPHPLSRKRLCPPPEPKGGGYTRLRVREGGSQFGRLEKKPSTLSTLLHLHLNPIDRGNPNNHKKRSLLFYYTCSSFCPPKSHTVLFFFVKKYTFLRMGMGKGVNCKAGGTKHDFCTYLNIRFLGWGGVGWGGGRGRPLGKICFLFLVPILYSLTIRLKLHGSIPRDLWKRLL
jgi:hypothetical protein